MKTFRQFFLESIKDTVVFAYGRYNPPTVGHMKLIEAVVNAAKKNNSDYLIVPSHSTKPLDKNPLTVDQKIEILKHMVPDSAKVSAFGSTYINTLQKLQEMGFQNVIQVCGSDREPEFKRLVDMYNGKPDKTGKVPFNFQSFTFISSGDRDPDSEGVEGMSASKLRKLAIEGNVDEFKRGMADSVPDEIKTSTYNILRKILAK
jgi:cytidyltransferase-like protein